MTEKEKKIVKDKNKFMRYKLIKDLYYKVERESPYTPLTKILQFYIFPKYPISRVTLYNILSTSVDIKLKEIEEIENKYNKPHHN